MNRHQGAAFRGDGCGTKHFISNSGIADMAVIGEPTARRLVTEHIGSGVGMTTHGKSVGAVGRFAQMAAELEQPARARGGDLLWQKNSEKSVVEPGAKSGS